MTKQVSTQQLIKMLIITLLGAAATTMLLAGIINWTTRSANAASPSVAYWHLDEASGPTYADSNAGTHPGTCTNCPTAATGQVNGAQSFDGINDTIDVSANSAFDWGAADTFSIEFWVNANSCTSSDETFIGRGTAAGEQWSIGCNSTDGTVMLSITDTTSTNITLSSTKVITDSRWHHLTAVYDGPNNAAWLYVDGSDIVSTTTSFTGSFAPTAANINIGHLNGTQFFNGTIDEVAIHNTVQTATDSRTHYYLSRGYTESCTSDVTIMPLGDSITQGFASGVADLDKQVSYRRDLWQLLSNNGYQVDFVGTRTNGEYYQPLDGFDPNHEGWPGWRDDQVVTDIYNNGGDNWLGTNPADVVLLHIGTNGMDQNNTGADEVEAILDEIDEFEADNNTSVTVILALIINRAPTSTYWTQFNANVQAMAEARIANGDKIIIVDMENGAGLDYSDQAFGGDFYDYLHPFATGYTKMANVWYDALDDFMPFCPGPPTIISTPITNGAKGQTYSYDVNANSNIQPVTYSLTMPPAGMVITSTTGEIQWTPSLTGTFNITVEVANNEGSAIQSYTLTVNDPITPTITSTPITTTIVNDPYVYNVDATGVPSPTFSLVTFPAGMTIFTDTGRIEWIPTSTGPVNVTVAATNSAGTDTDSFTLTVEAAPSCPADITAYWHLNASISNTFHDSIGNNDATCTGADCPNVVSGRINNAADFDGVEDTLSVPHTTDFNWQNSDSFSFELWVNTTQVCSGNKVFMGKHSGAASWWVGCDTNNKATFFLRDSFGASSQINSTTSINDGQWHHIVAVRDGSANENRLYVDSNQEGFESITFGGHFINSSDMSIGNFLNSFWYDGLIDELAIYSRALTAQEIQLHHANGSANTGYCTDLSPAIITSSAVTSAITGLPYSYDVDATGYPTPQFTSTVSPTGMTLNSITGLLEWTPGSAGNVNVSVTASNSQGSNSQEFTIEVVDPTAPVFTSTPITTGYENQIYVYDVDATGIPNPTFALTGTVPGNMSINETTGLIQWSDTAAGMYSITVEATNIVDTVQQIFTLDIDSPAVCSNKELASYWQLDTIQSSTTFTDTMLLQDATCSGINCPTVVPGKIGNAASFDGINDGLDVGNQAEYNWLNNESFSFELWVNTTQSCSGNKVYIGKNVSNGASWWVGCDDNNNAKFSLRDSNGNQSEISSTAVINDGNWHHIVAVRDSITNENRLYVDGIVATATPSYTGDFSNNNSVTIGYYVNSFRADAMLDEVAIYNRAISEDEIFQHLYNEINYCATSAKPVIYSTAVTTGSIESPYSYDVDAAGILTPTYSLETAPTGMTISETSGLIEWTPGINDYGDHSVSVKATNASGNDIQNFTLSISAAPDITTTAITTHELGGTYTYDVDATGHPSISYDFVGIPPAGMTIVTSTGEISWTPAITGFFDITVIAQNIAGQDQQSYTLVVGNKPVVTSTPILEVITEDAYTYDVDATGYPTVTFALNGTPPSGMTIDPDTGVISWPTAGSIDTYSIEVAVSNAIGTTLHNFDLDVTPVPIAPTITSVAPTDATINVTYSYDVEVTGFPEPTFTLLENPVGMSIDPDSGLIEWTPTAEGDFAVKVRASNNQGFVEQSFTITVVDEFLIFIPFIVNN